MIPEPVTRYRDWILSSSIKTRLLLFVGINVLFLATGLNVDLLIATFPRLLVRVLLLAVLVFILYTLYAIVRSFIPRIGAPPDANPEG